MNADKSGLNPQPLAVAGALPEPEPVGAGPIAVPGGPVAGVLLDRRSRLGVRAWLLTGFLLLAPLIVFWPAIFHDYGLRDDYSTLREAHEEIVLVKELVEFAGYLPDHIVVTGFRVTPCVGFVRPEYQLRIAAAEVHDAFEVPLDFILDSANHKARQRRVGETTVEVHDIPYGDRNIWGATAGMLMTFRHLLQLRLERGS